MSWFKRKAQKESPEILCGVSGRLIPQSKLPDPVFSQGMMGKGYGIIPESGEIYAPFDGIVEMTFPTGHALGLKRNDGMELLIHIGIDTVSLKGEGFEQLVREKDHVRKGQLITRFDPDLCRRKGLDPTVMFVITAQPDPEIDIPQTEKDVDSKDVLISG